MTLRQFPRRKSGRGRGAFAHWHLPAVESTAARGESDRRPITLCGLVDTRFKARLTTQTVTCPSCQRIAHGRPQLVNRMLAALCLLLVLGCTSELVSFPERFELEPGATSSSSGESATSSATGSSSWSSSSSTAGGASGGGSSGGAGASMGGNGGSGGTCLSQCCDDQDCSGPNSCQNGQCACDDSLCQSLCQSDYMCSSGGCVANSCQCSGCP